MPELDAEQQRRFALEVVQRLRDQGYQSLWAGGCVRDQLLGRPAKDYDVATNATPEQVRDLFGRRRTLLVGAAFGVAMVVGPKRCGQVEVTTFRRDAAYSDGRHPDAVVFSTPEEDAQRRDFTINGLFYDPLADEVIDYVGGRDDLQRGVIRAIGNPQARFEEDHLRMLRAVRFTARFNFALDADTLSAIRRMAHDLSGVSPERIAQEMRAMLAHPHRGAAVRLLVEANLASAVLPEILPLADSPANCPVHDNAWQHTLAVVDELGDEAEFPLALAALLHRCAGDNAAATVAQRWRLANKEQHRASWLVAHQAQLRDAPQQPWSQVQPLLVREETADLVALHEAIARADALSTDDYAWCRERLAWPAGKLDPPPLVTGHDLAAHGLKPGKQFAVLLERLRAAQLDGQIGTRAEALELADRILSGK